MQGIIIKISQILRFVKRRGKPLFEVVPWFFWGLVLDIVQFLLNISVALLKWQGEMTKAKTSTNFSAIFYVIHEFKIT